MFASQATHLVRGSELLTELLTADPGDRAGIGERMREAEHAADDDTHEILSTVNQTFVTPFEREDIYDLAARLDDVMDAMEEAVDLVVLYGVDELPGELAVTVGVLGQAARRTAEAV